MSWAFVYFALLFLLLFLAVLLFWLADSNELLERVFGSDLRSTVQQSMRVVAAVLLITEVLMALVIIIMALFKINRDSYYREYEHAKAETFKERLSNHGSQGLLLAPLIDVEERTQRVEDMLSEVLKALASLQEQVAQLKPNHTSAATGATAHMTGHGPGSQGTVATHDSGP
jgi:hypothetical protein